MIYYCYNKCSFRIHVLNQSYRMMYLCAGDMEGTGEDTIEFQLKVCCKKNDNAASDATDPDDLYCDHKGQFTAVSHRHSEANINNIHTCLAATTNQ